MNESSNNPVDNWSGLDETITTALRQPTFFWAWLLGGGGVPSVAHNALCGRDVRHLPRDEVAGGSHRREW